MARRCVHVPAKGCLGLLRTLPVGREDSRLESRLSMHREIRFRDARLRLRFPMILNLHLLYFVGMFTSLRIFSHAPMDRSF